MNAPLPHLKCPHCSHELPTSTLTPIVEASWAPTDLVLTLATAELEDDGLLAYCRFRSGPYEFARFAVRLTEDGRTIVTWPASAKAEGRRHYVLATADDALRIRIEARVITAYVEARRKAGRRTS